MNEVLHVCYKITVSATDHYRFVYTDTFHTGKLSDPLGFRVIERRYIVGNFIQKCSCYPDHKYCPFCCFACLM